MDRGSQLDEEDEEEEERRTRQEEAEEEEEEATDIKSNNPHLAGGEQNISLIILDHRPTRPNHKKLVAQQHPNTQ